MAQEQVFGGGSDASEAAEGGLAGGGQLQASAAGLDDLLDDIDSLLATDSQAFVKGFVQKGGE